MPVPLGTELRTALADPAAFDAEHPPGAYFRYANLNFPLIASIMERAAGERFDRLMARLVLEPLALDACFNWTTCSDACGRPRGRALRAGRQRDPRRPRRRRPACPVLAPEGVACELGGYAPGSNGALFSPQGGLRASVRDLAVIGRLLLNRGLNGDARFLSEASINALLSPSGTSTEAMATRRAASIVPMASPPRACRWRSPAVATICSATVARSLAMPATPMASAPACGSIRAAVSALPISPPATATIRRAAVPPIARSRKSWLGTCRNSSGPGRYGNASV
jgi:CubicO group peptidase (beta-lactamase class C family)